MVEQIRTNWNARAEVAGEAIVKFTIQRDGTIVNADDREAERLHRARHQRAARALLGTRQLPPLPGAFPNPTLTVHLNFRVPR